VTKSIVKIHGRPRVLFVTSHWPLAPAYGAQQRVLNIGKLLAKFAEVSWVIAPSENEDEDTARRTMHEYHVRAVMRPTTSTSVGLFTHPFQRLRHELDRSYIGTDNYIASASDRAKLQKLISEYDVVWMHTIRTAHWFRIDRWPHSVLDIDDLPSSAYRSRAQSNGSLQRRLNDRRMAWIWERRESSLLEQFDILAVCSEADKSCLRIAERIHVIPNGANLQPIPARRMPERPVIGFIGNCRFTPNEHGLKWFIREVWPLVKRDMPSAQLRLVGSGSEGCLSTSGPDIVACGWLADPSEEIASWSAMIVPIKIGSGTRVKIADGFARKCPVVSTPFGAFGYDVANGGELMLADTPEDFAMACEQLIRCPSLGEGLAERAYARFLECWTWTSFQSTVETAVEQCLARTRCSAVAESPVSKLQMQA
jgi:glycosyltransferase involved in cell wall biosynthesis